MKTFVPLKQNSATLMLVILFTVSGMISLAQGNGNQNSPNLNFSNGNLNAGQAGNINATYFFPAVNESLDAFVRITDRSSSQVRLERIDITSTGFIKALQPEISYSNGSVSSASNWWMEFEISFVNKNTTTPATINNFKATAIDIDGDNNRLKEWMSFYGLSSYMTENNSMLVVNNLTQVVSGLLQTVGSTFTAPINQYNGIDTNQTGIMTTVTYQNKSSFKFRVGGSTTGAASSTNRMYSIWFREFMYSAPIITSLPVKLTSFTAVLSQNQNKVDLKWTTASEINVSHFVIERSFDGKNFSEAGLVFATGNTSENVNYSFADNITNTKQPMIYYRLRSVDNDSKSQWSDVRVIRVGKQAEAVTMVTYPNPVSNELRVTVPSSWQGKSMVLEIFTQNGQRVKTLKAGSASQTETIAVSDLAKGFYLVKASCGDATAVQKIIKN
ncbi:MAG TPA: T9SS type A sorting domain-containing protein [Chitinophagaceae bacterium]